MAPPDASTVLIGDSAEWELIRYPTQDAARAAQRLRLGDAITDRVYAFLQTTTGSSEPSFDVDLGLYEAIEAALGCWPMLRLDDDTPTEYWVLGNRRFTTTDRYTREHLYLKGKPIFCKELP